MRVLLDTNVVIDVLQKREPWFESGKAIFLAIANRQITGCLTAKQIADLHFFSRKQFTGTENVDEKARKVITGLLGLVEILDTKAEDCQNAIGINNNDYEDAILISTAQREKVDYIVMRNPEHFLHSAVPFLSPDEFLPILHQKETK